MTAPVPSHRHKLPPMARHLAGAILPVIAVMIMTASPAHAASPLALDEMMVKFITNVAVPIMKITNSGAYIFGIYLVGQGLLKAVKYADEGSRGQKLGGVYGSMLIGALLCALPSAFAQVGNSLFTDFQSHTATPLTYAGMDDVMMAKLNITYQSVLLFVQMVGLISFVRGLSILRQVTDGNTQVTSMAGITHMLGGAMAWNLSGLIDVIGNTVGCKITAGCV